MIMKTLPLFPELGPTTNEGETADSIDHHMQIAIQLAKTLQEQARRDQVVQRRMNAQHSRGQRQSIDLANRTNKQPQLTKSAANDSAGYRMRSDKVAHAICDHLLASLRADS